VVDCFAGSSPEDYFAGISIMYEVFLPAVKFLKIDMGGLYCRKLNHGSGICAAVKFSR